MILLNIFTSLLLSLHPFHVSVMSIHHAADEKTLQITLKIFADDLEETPVPTELELTTLRDLQARTTAAHGGSKKGN